MKSLKAGWATICLYRLIHSSKTSSPPTTGAVIQNTLGQDELRRKYNFMHPKEVKYPSSPVKSICLPQFHSQGVCVCVWKQSVTGKAELLTL